MNLDDTRELIYWELGASQRPELIRSRDKMRTFDDKERRMGTTRDTHLSRITWKDVDTAGNGTNKTRMRWRLKLSKRDTGCEKHFQKTFIVDGDRRAVSAGFAIS